MKILFILSFFFAASALADANPIVIFFGGTGTSQDDMTNWEQSANQQCGTQYKFRAVPYRAGFNPNKVKAVAKADSDIRTLNAEIASHPNQKYIISCHSSGCAAADELAEQVSKPKSYAQNILELNNLEGFRPSPELQKKIPTTCWSAKNPNEKAFYKKVKNKKTNQLYMKAQSPTGANWNSMSACQHHEVLETTSCKSQWCAHWSLVNKGSKTSSPNPKDPDTGAFNANLAWLKGCGASRGGSNTQKAPGGFR